MNTLKSKDGTTIAFDQQGGGRPLILVDGAMSTRSSGSKPELAKLLAQHFTVYSYDRRGRGASGDTTFIQRRSHRSWWNSSVSSKVPADGHRRHDLRF